MQAGKGWWRAARLLAGGLALGLALAQAAAPIGREGLEAQRLRPPAAGEVRGALPVRIESVQQERLLEGHAYAELEHPFASVAAALSQAGAWCEILVLHLNTKYCGPASADGRPALEVRVGTKREQPLASASAMVLAWQPAQVGPDYLRVGLQAPDGPYGTREFELLVEVVPAGAGRSFLHVGYSVGYGRAGELAMNLYLRTIGRDKVGFSREGDAFVGGLRGAVERNTMRYFLAIDAYLRSLAQPPERQLEYRLQAWFDATEQYPRQLHEVSREDYLRMKREEARRQRERGATP